MRRLFVEPSQLQGKLVSIVGSDAHHLARVLRLGPGDRFEVVAGGDTPGVYGVQVVSVTADRVEAEVVDSPATTGEMTVDIVLCQALVKGDKMDWIVQKSVELGVKRIIPFVTQRTVVKVKPEKAESRVQRWQRIAKEAAKQSGRDRIPQVDSICSFQQLICHVEAVEKSTLVLLPWECFFDSGLQSFANSSWKQVWLIIGPEGGFTSSEASLVAARGGNLVSLGPRILRAETAAIAAVSMAGYIWGDLGGH